MSSWMWRQNGAFRYLAGSVLGLLGVNILFRVLDGRWPDRGLTLWFVFLIVGVAVLRLLVAYWAEEDESEASNDAARPASGNP